MARYPFLISIPHGGLKIPDELHGLITLNPNEIIYYSDPETRVLFDFRARVMEVMDTSISRLVVDLNRPPYALPPRHTDGAVKLVTSDKKSIYCDNRIPDITLIHRIMMRYYFPFHARMDKVLDQKPILISFDCHSMLPVGPANAKDAGKERPLICLGNNGDRQGKAKKGRLATCNASWIEALATAFRDEFKFDEEVAINDPFSGGFITNAHYWHTGIPFIQIEVNRSLYESGTSAREKKIINLRTSIWKALVLFWQEISEKSLSEHAS